MIIEKIVPDFSVIVEGTLSKKIEEKKLKAKKTIIPYAVIAYCEELAHENKMTGHVGLTELHKLSEIAKRTGIAVEYSGRKERRAREEARAQEVSAITREIAWDEDATLFTSDSTQALIAETLGITVQYIEPITKGKKPDVETFFDETTMSVHLRENSVPIAKVGKPGQWKRVEISDKPLCREDVQVISREIIESCKRRKDSVIEIERVGSSVIQMGSFRIVITEPPFSDGWEITAVRAVAHLNLSDYQLSEPLRRRITEQAEGILISGRPGEGKTTFARALAEYFVREGKIVKTVESPRDMLLKEEITQYSLTHSERGEIHDVLLLSRPDNTFFDEMRNVEDFSLFTDLRLAGIGMAGVVHATNPIDAIQRFIGKIEMRIIPQVIDTVIFVQGGTIQKVLTLAMTVKVPSGMTEADLARPVIEIRDFDTNALEFEIYSYGEHTVVVPVSKTQRKALWTLAEEKVREHFTKYVNDCDVQMISDDKCIVSVPERAIAKIVGREGKNIAKIENELGLRIDIQPLKKRENLSFEVSTGKKTILFHVSKRMANKEIELYDKEDLLVSATCGKKGIIRIKTDSPPGRSVVKALNADTLRLVAVENE
jgi:ATPase